MGQGGRPKKVFLLWSLEETNPINTLLSTLQNYVQFCCHSFITSTSLWCFIIVALAKSYRWRLTFPMAVLSPHMHKKEQMSQISFQNSLVLFQLCYAIFF